MYKYQTLDFVESRLSYYNKMNKGQNGYAMLINAAFRR